MTERRRFRSSEQDQQRARELDDRPAAVLDSLARDLAAEMCSPVAFAAERELTYRRLYTERWMRR